MPRKRKEIELLNSEGKILSCMFSVTGYVLYDQYDSTIGIFSEYDLRRFLDGKIVLIDSRGKKIDYTDFSSDMKSSSEEIDNFLKSNNNE